MALTTTAAGRTWHYSHHIGRAGLIGRSFDWPVGVAPGAGGRIHVANRSGEQNPNQHITVCTLDEEHEFDCGLDQTRRGMNARHLFTWLTGICVDSQGYFYGSDEWMDFVVVFDPDGYVHAQWGMHGRGPGQLDGAAGLATGPGDCIWSVSSRTSRVQQFDYDGHLLSGFRRQGSRPEELLMPSGIDLGIDGSIYVADWGNHRVQRYDPDGRWHAHLRRAGPADSGAPPASRWTWRWTTTATSTSPTPSITGW